MYHELNQDALLLIEQNDDSITALSIRQANSRGIDFDRLGRAIARNTNITNLEVYLGTDITDTGFYDGLKQNSSIHEIIIRNGTYRYGFNPVGREILQAYQENNNHLKRFSILQTNLSNGLYNIITTTLRRCTNLEFINFYSCNMTDDQFIPKVEAMRGINSLEKLLLNSNSIGNAGCEALATLLEDPNSNLEQLQLFHNNIGNEGAIAIANSLTTNTKLQNLYFGGNLFDTSIIEGVFSKVLCNTASINETYLSNHKIEQISLPNIAQEEYEESQLEPLLTLNKGINKRHVAIKKIVLHHPNIDMKPFFKLDRGEEDNLKALPYIVDWFDRAREVVWDYHEIGWNREELTINQRKLSAIYEFAKAMPLQLIPATHTKVDVKKRKRIT